jgi:hypothetical protein
MTTYVTISEFAISFVSNTNADIPLILHCLSAIFLSCSIDSSVLSDDIPSLNVTKIAVSPSLYAISFILSGNISTGTFDPNKSATLTTFSTLSNCLNLSSNFCISFVLMFSVITIEYEPILNSFVNMFSP